MILWDVIITLEDSIILSITKEDVASALTTPPPLPINYSDFVPLLNIKKQSLAINTPKSVLSKTFEAKKDRCKAPCKSKINFQYVLVALFSILGSLDTDLNQGITLTLMREYSAQT